MSRLITLFVVLIFVGLLFDSSLAKKKKKKKTKKKKKPKVPKLACEACQNIGHSFFEKLGKEDYRVKSKKTGAKDAMIQKIIDDTLSDQANLERDAGRAGLDQSELEKGHEYLVEKTDDLDMEGILHGATSELQVREALCESLCKDGLWETGDETFNKLSPLEQEIKKGADFLAENGEKEGVISTGSGLQYKVLTAGDGDAHPTYADTVKVHYKGTLLDGTEFDSSYKNYEPATFGVTGVISGWTEALLSMVKGDKWEVYIPSKLGYGDAGTSGIPGGALLTFQVELLEILEPEEPDDEEENEDVEEDEDEDFGSDEHEEL